MGYISIQSVGFYRIEPANLHDLAGYDNLSSTLLLKIKGF